MTIEIKLPEATPSLNETRKWHWAREHKEKQRWLWMVKSVLGPSVIEASQAKGSRRLVLERFGVRPVDADNLAGGAKGLIDALKQLGLVRDDSPTFLELEAKNGKREKGQAPWTKLTLEDVP